MTTEPDDKKPDRAQRGPKPSGPAKPFPPSKPTPIAYTASKDAREVARLREVLAKAAAASWSDQKGRMEREQASRRQEARAEGLIESDLPETGEMVLLPKVDYTFQTVFPGGRRVVLHTDSERRRWGLVLEPSFNRLVDTADEIRLIFGFEDCHLWDLVGRVIHLQNVAEDVGLGRSQLPLVQVTTLYRPGQFLARARPKEDPEVPGLDDAGTALARIHGRAAVPRVNEPKELVPTLVEMLATSNLTLFRDLWHQPINEYTLRRRFDENLRAFRACAGRIAFDRYDEHQPPERYDEVGQIRLFLRRENTDGSVINRPLTFVRHGRDWRLKAGTI